MFEGGPAQRYQLPKDIATARAKDGQRPAFNANSYPRGLKEWVVASLRISFSSWCLWQLCWHLSINARNSAWAWWQGCITWMWSWEENVLTNWDEPVVINRLLRECWDTDPTKRPSFANIIKRLEVIQGGDQSSVKDLSKKHQAERCSIMWSQLAIELCSDDSWKIYSTIVKLFAVFNLGGCSQVPAFILLTTQLNFGDCQIIAT